jgi:hypothetical protein
LLNECSQDNQKNTDNTRTRNKSTHTTINDIESETHDLFELQLALLPKKHVQIKYLSDNAFPPISSHNASMSHFNVNCILCCQQCPFHMGIFAGNAATTDKLCGL